MSKVRLTGSNSGYVEIAAVADAGNLTFTMPTSGTALISNTGNVFSGITTTGQLDINGSIDVSSTSVFNDDVTLTGGSYNVVWDKSDNQLEFGDNAKLSFGASSDLQLYHNGTDTQIQNLTGGLYIGNIAGNSNHVYISTRNNFVVQTNLNEAAIQCFANGGVELFYNSSLKLNTTNTGAIVTGICTATSFSGSGEGLTRTTPYSHRNLIINGQFLVWQRATDSGSNTTDGYLSCDRWFHASSGATKQVYRQTFSPGQTDVPDNPFYYLKYDVTVGNNNVALRQRIEDVTRVQGEMTLSFWVKGTNPGGGQFNLTFRQNFGSGGSSVVDQSIANYTVSNTWTKKTFTFTPTSISGKTINNTNTSYYEIELFRQPAGDTSTAAFSVSFANVQLERGSVATPYEQKHNLDEFRACQRYFQRFQSAYSYRTMLGFCILANSSTVIELMPIWKTELRNTPSISVTGSQLQARAGVSGSANISLSGNSFAHSRERNQIVGHMWMTRSGGDAFVIGSSGRLFAQDAAYIDFDAEL